VFLVDHVIPFPEFTEGLEEIALPGGPEASPRNLFPVEFLIGENDQAQGIVNKTRGKISFHDPEAAGRTGGDGEEIEEGRIAGANVPLRPGGVGEAGSGFRTHGTFRRQAGEGKAVLDKKLGKSLPSLPAAAYEEDLITFFHPRFQSFHQG